MQNSKVNSVENSAKNSLENSAENSAKYIIAIDQGTTSSRALLVDGNANVVMSVQRELTQIYPKAGWVEHDPIEIVSSQLGVLTELFVQSQVDSSQISSIGISNQRETVIVWNRHTGKPVYNAIVWQCRRTSEMIDRLCEDSALRQYIVETTGLIPDAYFSASKIKWILDNVEGTRQQAQAGDLIFGTVDSWVLWNLTGGNVHATDYTNASRTMLFDIHNLAWDKKLLDLFEIPETMLPNVFPSANDYGFTSHPGVADGLKIASLVGDQQAALFGQGATKAGMAKNTYGTGCFLLAHTGNVPVRSNNRLLTTIAASAPGTASSPAQIHYAIEGSVFIGGAVVQWLRDGLGIINDANEVEALASSVEDSQGVVVVPAFTGLGAPHWNSDATGAIFGITRGVSSAHIARAALHSIALQVNDLMNAIVQDTGIAIQLLKVDGGASQNNLLMQYQSDISCVSLMRSRNTEATALGAAFLAGLQSGLWDDMDHINSLVNNGEKFQPKMDRVQREKHLQQWSQALNRVK